jgi:hypothetical protein
MLKNNLLEKEQELEEEKMEHQRKAQKLRQINEKSNDFK